MNKFLNWLHEHAAQVIFWVCFLAAISLALIGVVTPPPGIIDESVIRVIRDLLLYGSFGVLAIGQLFHKK